ncbi:unnamed protein product [Arctia plantaginis]|uniref:Uncharacterized protein n=1 Tax=Arctia plantaginis TaxID=874455 RepID=A0A8S1AF03_ARCPL|nr:unnamed protein product [Arctia plantaginis]
MLLTNNDYKMQGVNVRNGIFSPNNVKCIDINNSPLNGHQKNFINSIQNVKKTLGYLERSLKKTTKYEQKLMRCKNTHSHSHNKHKFWDSDLSEQKSFKCNVSNTNSSSSVSRSGMDQAESWSTMSLVCLQLQFEDLSKRYQALLQAYDDQCSALSMQDMKLAQWQQRASLTHAHLAHAHKALLTIGEKYLALKRKRHMLKSQYEERINQLKNILYDVVEVTSREQLRFDATLAYYMSSEHSPDAALLLYEIRKCNFLLMENMRLKTIIEELLPCGGNRKLY